MGVRESAVISVLILLLVPSRVSSVVKSENWGVTQFEELKLKYTWMINNFKVATLQETNHSIYSPNFWPTGNETFMWCLELVPKSPEYTSYMELYLRHNYTDKVYVNYTLSIDSVKYSFDYTFDGKIGYGMSKFIERDTALRSCLPNGTLIINCEIDSVSNIFEASGTNLDECTSMKDKTLKSKLTDDLLALLDDEKFTDVTIVTEEHEIRAHKAILAARSPVFASLFAKNNENSSFILQINDIKPKIFRQLLQYIYTDKIDIIDETVAKELITAAIKYDLKMLKAKCEEILCSSMNADNAIEVLEIADQNNISELKGQATKFVAEHASAVIHSNKFKKLERTKPHPMYDIFRILAYKSNING